MRLNEIYQKYNHQVEFFTIYIREAHPSDGWQVHENLEASIIIPDPKTDGERAEVAYTCQTKLDIHMPILIDTIENDVEEKYIAHPLRLFLVDADGLIAYAGGQGPMNFDPDGWEAAINRIILSSRP